MTAIPALVAILALGVTPLGAVLVSAASWLTGFPSPICLVALYVLIIGLGTVLLMALRHLTDESDGLLDEFLDIGSARGQRWLDPLLGLTVGMGILAMGSAPWDALSLGCVLAAGVVGIGPGWAVRRSLWPIPLAVYEPPAPAPAPAAMESDDAEERVQRTFSWRFAPSLGSPGPSSSFTLTLPMRRRIVQAFADMDHPRPASYSEKELNRCLNKYLHEGRAPEVERCALELVRLARSQKLPHLDFVAFILSFCSQAVADRSDSDLYGREGYWAYPVETLWHQAGDADNQVILAGALCSAVGFEVTLIPSRGRVALGVRVVSSPVRRFAAPVCPTYYYASRQSSKVDWLICEALPGVT